MFRTFTLLAAALLLLNLPQAQAAEPNDQVQSLIQLTQHGISPHLMEVWIQYQPQGPQPDAAAILLLSQNKVPDSVVEALIKHNAEKPEVATGPVYSGTVASSSGWVTGSRVVAPEPVYTAAPAVTYASVPAYYSSPYSSSYDPYYYTSYPSYYPFGGSFFFGTRFGSFGHSGFSHHGFSGGSGFRGGSHHR